MRKFAYIGDCAKGEVVFREIIDPGIERKTVMPKGEAVPVSDALAAKLANNNHFVEVAGEDGRGIDSGNAQEPAPGPAIDPLPPPAEDLCAKRLSRAERRALVAQRLRETPEISDRQIARALGVSHPTVAAMRARLESAGELPKTANRMGADGKKRSRGA